MASSIFFPGKKNWRKEYLNFAKACQISVCCPHRDCPLPPFLSPASQININTLCTKLETKVVRAFSDAADPGGRSLVDLGSFGSRPMWVPREFWVLLFDKCQILNSDDCLARQACDLRNVKTMRWSCPSTAGRDLLVLCQPHAAPGLPVLVISGAFPGCRQPRGSGDMALSLLLPWGWWSRCLCPKRCFGTNAIQNWCGQQEHNRLSSAPPCCSSRLPPTTFWQIPRIRADSYNNIY